MLYRKLTKTEIGILEDRGCRAADWNMVTVAAGFSPGDSFRNVRFSGRIELGCFREPLPVGDGLSLPSGISDSELCDVSVGNDCVIRRSSVSSADIGEGVLLDDIGVLARPGRAPFANGSQANVLAEDGARSVSLWRHLSAQLAHILCHLKGHPAANALEEAIRLDAESLALPRSVVSSGCRLRRVGALRDVWIGEGAVLDGVSVLENCHVGSSREAPARIGEGTAAKDCVFLAESETAGGVRLEHCLVGEGVRLANGFTGKHSLFFANSEFTLGEAACAMAGPFAVSHHKATLILTCQCSFNTFGSAANSSNHHFKLGPIHGGVLRRGARCGSGSYIFWPSDIGAFSTVVGKHMTHLDTADFPFSLLVGKEDRSILVPGVNLFASGGFRDAIKWRDRDRRTGLSRPRDLVNPAILSPYVLQAMRDGAELLRRGLDMAVDLRHGGAVIPARRFEPALKLYDAARVFHMGERLFTAAQFLRSGGFPEPDDLAEVIAGVDAGDCERSGGRWRDWGGMLLSGFEAERFLADLANGTLKTPEEVRLRFEKIHEAFSRHELAWIAQEWGYEYGAPEPATLAAFACKWRKAVHFRHECFVKDAAKEYSPEVRYGFGVEANANECFRRIRGVLSGHPLLARAEAERERLLNLASRI